MTLRKPPSRPELIIGLDVDTSDWDDSITMLKQTQHFEAGFPCRADHTGSNGCVCGLGYCVFSRRSDDSSIYTAEKPVSSIIKLAKDETISPKAFVFHGLSDAMCVEGEDFFAAVIPIIMLLKQGAQICCHHLAHETIVFCRELQKRSSQESTHFTKEDASLLMRCLYDGHCTFALATQGKYPYFRGLSDEYQRIFAPSTTTCTADSPGWKAFKCGRLFLHFNDARVATITDGAAASESTWRSTFRVLSTTDGEMETHQIKKAKSSTSGI